MHDHFSWVWNKGRLFTCWHCPSAGDASQQVRLRATTVNVTPGGGTIRGATAQHQVRTTQRRWVKEILEIQMDVPAATRENPWDFPLATRCGPIPLQCKDTMLMGASALSLALRWVFNLLCKVFNLFLFHLQNGTGLVVLKLFIQASVLLLRYINCS